MRKFKLSKFIDMIQRIQTVFLLLAILILGIYLYTPVIQVEANNFKDMVQGWELLQSFNGYLYYIDLIFVGTAAGLTLVNIFAFKNRSLQMLLCWFAIIFIASTIAFVYYKYQTRIFVGDVIFTWWNILPALAILLEILAFINIRKDENTIRSLNRLR